MNETIKKWREATEQVAKAFVEKYFPEQEYDNDTFWVADEVGGVFYVCDMFFNIDRMIEAIEFNATYKQIQEYNDAELAYHMEKEGNTALVNFKNYVKYGFNLNKDES